MDIKLELMSAKFPIYKESSFPKRKFHLKPHRHLKDELRVDIVPKKILQINKEEKKQKEFCCELCTRTFSKMSQYNQHMRVHTRERPFKCNDCQMSFTQKGALNKHIKTVHKKERQFKCEVCSMTFGEKCTLIRHNRIHTQERPFACTRCTAKFARKDHLNKHVQIH